jgi:hypothetical protein
VKYPFVSWRKPSEPPEPEVSSFWRSSGATIRKRKPPGSEKITLGLSFPISLVPSFS